MTIFFTSDTHLGHKNIIEYCNRPFSSVEEMDNTIIENWNCMVNPDDTVYHLGDFTLGDYTLAKKYFGRLNGQVKILTNVFHHDKRWLKALEMPGAYFYTKGEKEMQKVDFLPPLYTLELKANQRYPQVIVLCHYAMAIWDRKHYGSIHLFGHSHGQYRVPNGDKAMDVGVDCRDFYPVSLDFVLEALN